ncbi:unnamed protein product [Cyprideis torosa]|uniref:Uncharacterized protein n=1 Tax=Cyprideis torosa TaxID=163714 RepID=A0A7R8ZNA5_9CRUS|nr:unnamed protein product [Cyprideis torosa]CAG0895782.1 unnamed protein product [Cyprideis torosa]
MSRVTVFSLFLVVCALLQAHIEAQISHDEVEGHPQCPDIKFDESLLSGRCPGWCLSNDHCEDGTICCPNHCGGTYCYKVNGNGNSYSEDYQGHGHPFSRFSKLDAPLSLLSRPQLILHHSEDNNNGRVSSRMQRSSHPHPRLHHPKFRGVL